MICFLLRWCGCLRYVPVLLVLVCASLTALAQAADEVALPQASVSRQFPGEAPGINPLDGPQAMRRLRQLNVARQKAMVSDATRLLALARELNNDLIANKGGISPDEQRKKIAEIEKLAHSVKEKMIYAYAGNVEASPRNSLMNSWPQ